MPIINHSGVTIHNEFNIYIYIFHIIIGNYLFTNFFFGFITQLPGWDKGGPVNVFGTNRKSRYRE